MPKGTAGYKVRTITCQRCGRTITKRMPPGRSYCSLACYRTAPRPSRRTGTTRVCEWCGQPFYAPPSRGMARFCCRTCHTAYQGRNKTTHVCRTCGATFTWSPSRSRTYRITYCSIPCRDADPARREQLARMNAAQQASRVTGVERMGYAMLDDAGVEYLRQVPFGGKFTPDAVIPSARIVAQFDGDYWHDRRGTSTEPRIRRRVELDRSQDAYVRASGWEVIRFWESDLKDDPAGCVRRLSQLLHRPLATAPRRNPLARE